jgi:CHAT domain-containing protein/tetratricopeptide (TPR) repeat protein
MFCARSVREILAALVVATACAWSSIVTMAQEAVTAASGQEFQAQRDRLWEEAQRLRDEGKLAEAAGTGVVMLMVERQWLGEDSPDVIVSIEWLAAVNEQAEDWPIAQAWRLQAVTWREAHQGVEHWETVDARLSLENIHILEKLTPEERQRLAQANAAYLDAIRLHREGRAEEGIRFAEKSLDIRKAIIGEQHPNYARSLNTLGALYSANGDFPRAESLYQRALRVGKSVFGEQHPAYATTLTNLGGLYLEMGDFTRAVPLHQKALEVMKFVHGEQHPDYAVALDNLAALYHDLGDDARAAPLHYKAIEIMSSVLGPQHPDYAISLSNLARVYCSTGEYAKAEPLFRQSLEIRKSVFGERHPAYAMNLSGLGELYFAMGDYSQAESFFRQSLEIRKSVFGERHPDYATSLSDLAGVYFAMGDYAQAEPLQQRALAIFESILGKQHRAYAVALSNLAGIYSSMADYVRAKPLHEQAFEIALDFVESTSVVQDERGQLALGQQLKSALDSYVGCLLRQGGRADEAYRAVLNWKGATLMRQRAARAEAESDELNPVFAELQSVVRQWGTIIAATPRDDLRWKVRLAELTQRKEHLEAILIEQSISFRALGRADIANMIKTLPEGAVLVDYLEIWLPQPGLGTPSANGKQKTLVAFVVDRESNVKSFDLGASAAVDAAIAQWRSGYGGADAAVDAGAVLRERLWAPLEGAIGDAELVLISPDGALGKLPFAALPGSKPDTYLIEDVAIALVPVPRLIPMLQESDKADPLDHKLLLLGAVDYDQREGSTSASHNSEQVVAISKSRGDVRIAAAGAHWTLLPGTEAEVETIAKMYEELGLTAKHELTTLRGAAATEENFRATAPRSRILHLATHGFFADEEKKSALTLDERDVANQGFMSDRPAVTRGINPGLLSGIVLAGANAPPELPEDPAELATLPEDGILTAEELAFLPLRGVDLVVLSACETGLGLSAGGEGLLGIQRAFQVAGARTTIASLWKVDDAMTQRLMTSFYRNRLEHKQSTLDALRNAQLKILREQRETTAEAQARGVRPPEGAAAAKRGSPYYWAAFTLSGDWR